MTFGSELQEIQDVSNTEFDEGFPDFLKRNEAREFAPSMEVQAAEICDVFNEIPELKYEEWRELSIEDRADVLREFENKIAEIEMRNPMIVDHKELSDGVMGYYNSDGIMISDVLLGDNSYDAYRETLDTLFHEGRHAYQFYNLEVERTEASDELYNSWNVNENYLGYNSGDAYAGTEYEIFGYWEYYTQPVEVDARVFAETVINKLGI